MFRNSTAAALRSRPQFRMMLGIILILNESAWHIWKVSIDQWTVQNMLPLHLCSIMVWSSSIMLFTRSRRIYEFCYLLGTAGALQALLTPDIGSYGFPHFRVFQTFTAHSCIIFAAVYMTSSEGFRPNVNSIKRVLIGAHIYAAAVFFINQTIGSNYLFIARKPDTASLLDYMGPWPWYLIGIELAALLCVALLYLPFYASDRKVSKSVRQPAG